ncbi:hypothetical protein B0H14DRAFT_3084417 [Mycena olivaceomarginata]|nr:hypothetical protein B0H14DRAFT_3084417 [Mycena olivaceomarginata]
MDIDDSDNHSQHDPRIFIGPLLPGAYLRVVPHPHSTDPTPTITFARRWLWTHSLVPFPDKGRFEVTKIAVKGLLSKELTNNLLRGASYAWYLKGRSCVSLRDDKQMKVTLASARKICQFKSVSVSASYDGVNYNISFEYRDPWEWITRLLEDDTLGLFMMFNSVRKYYCEGVEQETFCERVIDEPNTADTWDEFDSELPDPDPYPHCFLPLHFWLDEGMVTKGVTMHPMVMRHVFLPGNIRNASGNGGGVLIGYMAGVPDPADPSVRKTAKTLEFAKFKMKVYQRVLKVIFASLQKRSWNGVPLECWDRVVRVFHPGVLITLANYPCAKCLVHHDELHCLPYQEVRTKHHGNDESSRRRSFACAQENGEGEHPEKSRASRYQVQHFLWSFRFSDPYAAYSMREFSRWPGLKHFNQVTAVHFTNGQSLRRCEPICLRVSDQYGKNFDFFKQHATSHIVEDILRKGTTNHSLTHLGEGFQQEAAEAYKQTNFKKRWPSGKFMDPIDETQEAITRIWMAVDNYEKQCELDEQEDKPELDKILSTSQINSVSWRAFEEELNSAGHPIHPFKCAHIIYQSLEDWRGLWDIVRCNPSFHGYSQYDSVLFNTDSPGMAFTCLSALMCCTLESKCTQKPRTERAGCQAQQYSLMLMDYVIRGTFLTPAAGSGKANLHFLVDTIDADMFLRADRC